MIFELVKVPELGILYFNNDIAQLSAVKRCNRQGKGRLDEIHM
jgi:hypothetical protein